MSEEKKPETYSDELEKRIEALLAERELLMAVVRAVVKSDSAQRCAISCSARYPSLGVRCDCGYFEVSAALAALSGPEYDVRIFPEVAVVTMCLHRREHIRMASLDHPQGAVCSDCGKALPDLETGNEHKRWHDR